MQVSFTDTGRDALDAALSRAPDHLRPLYLAARDRRVGFVFVLQGPGAFEIPSDRPQIVLVGDDFARALGPGGFDRASLLRYLARCRAVTLVPREPAPSAYVETVTRATRYGEDVAIIETRPERHAEWAALVREALPVPVTRSQGASA